jgi:membrane protein
MATTGTSRAERPRLAAALSLLARARRWFDASLLGRWWLQLLDLQFVDRAVALAAKAFVAFLPGILTFAALAPERTRRNMAESMERRLGLSGKSLELVESTLGAGDPVSSSTSVLSVVLLLFYATTFTSAMQRLFLAAWHRPTSRDRVRELKGLAWLVTVFLLLALFNAINRVFSGLLGTTFVAVLGFCTVVLLWWWTSYVMLRRQVRWRPLLPPAIVMAAAASIYVASAAAWVPRSMVANQEQFGFFGVSMTLVSWFVGGCFIIVVSAALGPVLATDTGVIGRLVRGGQDDLLRPGAPDFVTPLGEPVSPWHLFAKRPAPVEPTPPN